MKPEPTAGAMGFNLFAAAAAHTAYCSTDPRPSALIRGNKLRRDFHHDRGLRRNALSRRGFLRHDLAAL
jgi:hypothetical protein